MKELHHSSLAYLGGLKHIGVNPSLSPRFNPHTIPHRHQTSPSDESNNFAESYIQQIKLQYHQYIRSQFNLLQYMHNQLGFQEFSHPVDLTSNTQMKVEQILEESRVIAEKIVDRWKTVQDRQKQMENMKEVVLVKATEANQKLAVVEREKRQLEEMVVQLRNRFQSVLKQTPSEGENERVLTVKLQGAMEELRCLQSVHAEAALCLEAKEHRINSLSMEHQRITLENQRLKQSLSDLQNELSCQKEQNNRLIFEHKATLSAETPQEHQRKLESICEQNRKLLEDVEAMKKQKSQYTLERQSAMRSLNSITARVKQYQRQHSEEKLQSQNEIHLLRTQFKDLEQKYLQILMRSAKWTMLSNTLSLTISNKIPQTDSVECQTPPSHHEDPTTIQTLFQQFQSKSHHRLMQLCTANQNLARENETLQRKLEIMQNNNESLRRDLDDKKRALKRITEEGSLLTEDMAHLEKDEVIRTIGSKIETLRDIMKSLEGGDASESSIDIRCRISNSSEDARLQHLFEKKPKREDSSKRPNPQIKQFPIPTKRIEPHLIQRKPSTDHRPVNYQQNPAMYLQTFPQMNHFSPQSIHHHPQNNYQRGIISSPQPFNQRILSPTAQKPQVKVVSPTHGGMGSERRVSQNSMRQLK